MVIGLIGKKEEHSYSKIHYEIKITEKGKTKRQLINKNYYFTNTTDGSQTPLHRKEVPHDTDTLVMRLLLKRIGKC